MEIEAKFSIHDPATPTYLSRLPRLGDFTLQDEDCVAVQDTYMDTPEWQILAAGYACRYRQTAEQLLVSLKSLRGREGAIHQREEYEIALPDCGPPEHWPESDVRQRVLALTGAAPLRPLFTLQQERTLRAVELAGQKIATLSLDEVALHHNGRAQQYVEVEVELEPAGDPAQLQALVAHLAQLAGLTAQPLSKFERGLAFVQTHPDGAATPPDVTGLSPKTPDIRPDDALPTAALKILRRQLAQMLTHEPGVRLGEDLEAVHAMRVATRRMRTVFRIFEHVLDMGEMAQFLKGLKRAGRALGTVRDLDVFREHVWAYRDAGPPESRPDLAPLERSWGLDYQAARAELLAHLDSDRYRAFCREFSAYLQRPHSAPAALPDRVRDRLPGLLYALLAEVNACAESLEQPRAPLASYHELRIAAKHLRYMLEFCAAPLGREVKPAIASLKALQDHLGALQDAVVACERLADYLPAAENAPEVAAYQHARQADIARLTATFPAAWAAFAASDFNQHLAAAIAVL